MKNLKLAFVILAVTLTAFSCKKDKEAPEIKLLSGTSVKHVLNEPFTDTSFTANDNVDGDLTDQVTIVDSALNVDLVGIYPVYYQVSDAEGNETEVEQTVEVYNESRNLKGKYLGQYVFPYPGTEPVKYFDSVLVSQTVNNQVSIKYFADTISTPINGIVKRNTLEGTIIEYSNPISTPVGALNIASAKLGSGKITILYNLAGEDGQLILKKQ